MVMCGWIFPSWEGKIGLGDKDRARDIWDNAENEMGWASAEDVKR